MNKHIKKIAEELKEEFNWEAMFGKDSKAEKAVKDFLIKSLTEYGEKCREEWDKQKYEDLPELFKAEIEKEKQHERSRIKKEIEEMESEKIIYGDSGWKRNLVDREQVIKLIKEQ